MGYELAKINRGKQKPNVKENIAGLSLMGIAGFGSRFGYEYLTKSWDDIDTFVSAGALVSVAAFIGTMCADAIAYASLPRKS